MIIGVISDTHGLLRQSVIDTLKDCSLIIHAGDIGNIEIIDRLAKISKVICVRGNCDTSEELKLIPKYETIDILGLKLYIVHNIKDIKFEHYKYDIVIYGHSHKSNINIVNDTIYINPGSVGPRRFKLPTTMMKLYIKEGIVSEKDIEIIDIIT
ncbi:MAG: metallophosphoesterase family protein [Paraclostridium sp.]